MKALKQRSSRPPLSVSGLLLLLILLLAAGLRFYRLDAQSFWNDEGNSARIAERSLDLILEGAAGDIHPPGYYLLLHTWRTLFGQSESALRSLSVAAGLALVAFTYLLGRHLFGETTGLTAAFLGAISPLAIYYSQEARMYALLATLSAASTYLLLRLLARYRQPASNLQHPASRRTPQEAETRFSEKNLVSYAGTLIAYVFTGAAGLYTQYAFPFVLLVHNAVFGLWWLVAARRSANRWRWLALWAGAQAAVAALYLPWLAVALKSVTGWSAAGRAYELGYALLDVLRVLSVGITLPVEGARAAIGGTGLLLLAGLWPRRADRSGWLGIPCVALYLLLPVTLIFAFDLYKPAWLKFLVVVLPPFHLLVAHGVENLAWVVVRNSKFGIRDPGSVTRHLRPVIQLLVVSFLAATTVPSLHNLYFDPAYARDDYRQIAADIAAISRPGDGIVLNAPNQWEVFTYYYPDHAVHPAPYRPGPGAADAFLTPLTKRYQRLFVLYWGDAESDPQRRIETRLAGHAYKAEERWYGRVRLATYRVAPLPEDPAVVLDVRFGEAIRLRGYALPENALAPGAALPVTLFWEAETPIPERYKVTVQLLSSAGQLVAQHDTEPGAGLIPTTIWEPGQILADRYGVPLPNDLPPGRYALTVGLYHVASGERLTADTGGDHYVLCDVEVR